MSLAYFVVLQCGFDFHLLGGFQSSGLCIYEAPFSLDRTLKSVWEV